MGARRRLTLRPKTAPTLRSFSAVFSANETPVSLGGAVRQDGTDWTQVISTVVSTVGVAFGTQTEPPSKPPFDDSYTVIRSPAGVWLPDQTCECTIHLESGNAGNGEIWCGVRWTDSAHFSRGYEANLHYAGNYTTITAWPSSGALGTSSGQFREMVFNGGVQAPQDGDIFGLSIVGYTLTSYLKRGATTFAMATVTDTDATKIASGNPSFGFYQDGASASRKYGMYSVRAWEL